MRRLPVTIVTGFLGAGKTSLIRHLLGAPPPDVMPGLAAALDA